jgi:hypothetical protein
MEIQIGERMSEIATGWEGYVYLSNGEVYEDRQHALTDHPLDTGRLVYAKLRRAINPDLKVEVIWDHFKDVLTVMVTGRYDGITTSFPDRQMARVDKVERINQLVEGIKETEKWL